MEPIELADALISANAERTATYGAGARRVDSGSLLSGQRELIIEHAGCEYRLRRTQNDKLILTK
jgi:hemin uptake protein HemP